MPETSVEDEDMSVELPADVHDVGTWGKTIVKMEAYADRNWRYRQIVEEAKSDKKVHGYLSWIVKTEDLWKRKEWTREESGHRPCSIPVAHSLDRFQGKLPCRL